jgi:hypothetical protein
MINGRRLFYLFLVLGLISWVALWIAPSNEYEWMRSDPVVGNPAAQLPVDEDAAAVIAILSVPVILSALIIFALAGWGLRGRLRLVAIGFGAVLLGSAAIRLLG